MEGGLADKFLRDLEDLSADEDEEFKQDEGEEDSELKGMSRLWLGTQASFPSFFFILGTLVRE